MCLRLASAGLFFWGVMAYLAISARQVKAETTASLQIDTIPVIDGVN